MPRAAGARGEDWTGFLLGPVALALLALAVTLALALAQTGPVALAPPRRARGPHRRGGVSARHAGRDRDPRHPPPPCRRSATTLGRPYEQVTLRTSDGLRLAGWYVRSRNGAAVISYPTRAGKLPQARMLVRHGYGVLLLDARGYDGSQGDPNLFGWDDTKDIDAAVSWLQRQPDVRDGRVGGIGFSVGGEMMLQASAENTGLGAVVSDGAGFRSVREELLRGPRGWLTSLPEQALQSTALAVMSGTAPPPSLKDLVPRIAPRHVFLIHAGHGAGGEEYNRDYYAAAGAPKAVWGIPEAHHTGGFQARPREYERRVVGFFDRALLDAPARTPADPCRRPE